MFDFIKISRPRRMRVVCNGHPALRMKSLPVMAITDEIRELAQRMIVTMKENEIPGVGLAAPQVGVNKRMIVIDTRPVGRKEKRAEKQKQLSPGEMMLNPLMPLALVNPEILSSSAETETCGEGCLSLPGVEGEVTRPAKVLLRAKLLDGKEVMLECGGLLARCLQHEIDHLDGVLFYDRIPKEQQEAANDVMAELAAQEAMLAATQQKI